MTETSLKNWLVDFVDAGLLPTTLGRVIQRLERVAPALVYDAKLQDLLDELVAEERIVKLEYRIPGDFVFGRRNLYFPAGTTLRVVHDTEVETRCGE